MSEHFTPEDYAATGGILCPACGGTTLFPGQLSRRGMMYVTQPGRCLHCPATWTAIYTLTGYEALRPAQAVLEAKAGYRFAVGQRVTWDEAPGAVWQIVERRQHEGTQTTWYTYDLLPAAGDLTDFRPLCAAEAQLEAAHKETP